MDIRERIERLSRDLLRHQYLYYVKTEPEISDQEYDRMFDELVELERKYPNYALGNSPTKRIGSDLDNTFPERAHEIPVLSLDKEYTIEGLMKWVGKFESPGGKNLSFVVEEKIDGASIVLYYKNGLLSSALTRGNGILGNDVIENIRTIYQVPLIIDQPIDLAVRGEIFINRLDFQKYNMEFDNRYSNPRNLAAGSLRNTKSTIVSKIPLNVFVYEGYFNKQEARDISLREHMEILLQMKSLGFPVNHKIGFFSPHQDRFSFYKSHFPEMVTGNISDMGDYVREQADNRKYSDYEIDGLVVKINEISLRDELGYTSHHPRWAIAFKFDSPVGHTVLNDILIQVGRNGRVTPVAVLNPVSLGGSMVSRATLHNQEYIEMLELGIGDTVRISRRGDVIPAVEEVIEKNIQNPSIYKLVESCPFCHVKLIKIGSHHFCPNRDCPERIKRSIIYFAAKDQMDIEHLGEKTIEFLFERGFITGIPDIYALDYHVLLSEDGYKEKKIENIIKSIESSKKKPFKKVLTSLGFEGLGWSTVSELIDHGYRSVDKIIETASRCEPEKFSNIPGFGDITANLVIQHFTDKKNLEMIRALKEAGLNFSESENREKADSPIFDHQIWVITGSFQHFVPRSKAAEEIEKRGGKISHSVSANTTHLLCGSVPGSKLERARELNVRIVDETEFLEMISWQ
jgi:DNA ligase (NAD+)